MNKKEILTEKDLKLSSENATAFSAAAVDYTQDINMPFKFWVKGIYKNNSRKYMFTANAPGAHINKGPGYYQIQIRGSQKSTIHLYDYNGDSIAMEHGINYSFRCKLEYNREYYFVVAGAPASTDTFEICIEYNNHIASDSSEEILTPHGNYLTFTCKHPTVCNNGIGNNYGDKYHQGQTAYMNGILNADIHRYIVIPQSVDDYPDLLGCVGAAVRDNGRCVFGVVGEVGIFLDHGVLDEFSVRMIKDLGFNTNCKSKVEPEKSVTTYVFPDTARGARTSETLNEDVKRIGREYFKSLAFKR